MNPTIKKFLCKYFADTKNKVTVGSILEHIYIFIIRVIIVIGVLFIMYCSMCLLYIMSGNASPETMTDSELCLGIIGLCTETILIVIGGAKLYNYISKIEITRCEKEEKNDTL